jgi:hypothetical protein
MGRKRKLMVRERTEYERINGFSVKVELWV